MAKALLGYVGGPDPRLVTEVRRLQRRVHDLEAEVQRLQAQNDLLVENVDGAHIALEDLPAREPVPA
jgi:uncharacterized protein YlxW (UPF0749 family)